MHYDGVCECLEMPSVKCHVLSVLITAILCIFCFADIYHRILRFKNYMIAMVNKSLLPLRHEVPIFGEM